MPILPMILQDAEMVREPWFVELLDRLWSLVPSALTLFLTIIVAVALQKWLERRTGSASSNNMRDQLLLLTPTVLGLLAVVLMLPISDTIRGDILRLIGIVLSASVALSSTTIMGNMLAGFMLRSMRNFRAGDFIGVEDHFGRVSERGLFHTEIQTEERNLTTLPNLYLIRNPVTTVRSSGTIVATTVSLGYDVPRSRIEQMLLQAAQKANLKDSFVSVVDLGDFSVTYRLAGLLTEVKSLISARSRLRGKVLDSLHEGGVEIVSPSFMNTRALSPDRLFIPQSAPGEAAPAAEGARAPEDILFDKADEAEAAEEIEESIGSMSDEIRAVENEIKNAPDDLPAGIEKRRRLEARRDWLVAQRDRLVARLEEKRSSED